MERIVIEIVGDTTKIQSTIDQLQKLGQVDNQNAKTFQANNNKTNQALNQTSKDVGFLNNQLQNLGNTIAGAFAVGALVSFGKQAVKTSAQIESVGKSLEFITGGAKSAQATMEYLRSLSEKLGLDFISTAKAFKQFAGAAMQSGSTLGQSKTIFEQVSKAVTTMGLSAEDAEGVFLALSQIMSKGTVQAEELRGQIGERIPGAFGIAARAIGVTEQKLNKMLEQGQVISKDFLPKFAAQLEKDLGGGAENAANSTQAALNRLSNAWNEFLTFTGQKLSPAIKSLTKIFQGLTYAMRGEAGEREAASRQQGVEYAKEIVSELDKLNDLNAKSDAALEKRNFYYKRLFQTQQEINSLLAEREAIIAKGGAKKNPRLDAIELEIEALAGNKYMYEEIITALKDYDKEINKDNQVTEENTKKKEKQLTAYERLTQKASELESKLRDVYASGEMANTPLEIKLRTILNEIDLINTKVEQAKNGMQTMTLTAGTEKGGTPKAFTTAITAFGSVQENKLATDDIVKNAEKANEEFARIEEERTRKFQEEQDKRKAAEEAFYASIPELASEAINTIMQLHQMQIDWEFNLLETQVANKEITEKEYEQKRKVLLKKQAEQEKQAAIFQATLSMANAILKALESGPIIGPIMAAIIGALGIAQVAAISAAPLPQYAEGTDFVALGKNRRGKDTIPAMLNEGEAVIKTDENSKYPGLAKAWNDGKLDDYVMSNFMIPMINPKSYELEQQKSFAENVANSIVLNQDFGTLENKLKRIEQAEREGAVYLGKKIEKAINNQTRGGF